MGSMTLNGKVSRCLPTCRRHSCCAAQMLGSVATLMHESYLAVYLTDVLHMSHTQVTTRVAIRVLASQDGRWGTLPRRARATAAGSAVPAQLPAPPAALGTTTRLRSCHLPPPSTHTSPLTTFHTLCSQIGSLQGAAQLFSKASGSVSGILADVVTPARLAAEGFAKQLQCQQRCRPAGCVYNYTTWPVATLSKKEPSLYLSLEHRMVILGAALTALNKPMYAASGAVAALAGTTACLWWVTFAKVGNGSTGERLKQWCSGGECCLLSQPFWQPQIDVCCTASSTPRSHPATFHPQIFDRAAKGIREAPSKALIGELAASSGDSPTAAFGLRQSMALLGASAGASAASLALALTGGNYPLTFALSTVPAVLALLLLSAAFGPGSKAAAAAGEGAGLSKLVAGDASLLHELQLLLHCRSTCPPTPPRCSRQKRRRRS